MLRVCRVTKAHKQQYFQEKWYESVVQRFNAVVGIQKLHMPEGVTLWVAHTLTHTTHTHACTHTTHTHAHTHTHSHTHTHTHTLTHSLSLTHSPEVNS